MTQKIAQLEIETDTALCRQLHVPVRGMTVQGIALVEQRPGGPMLTDAGKWVIADRAISALDTQGRGCCTARCAL